MAISATVNDVARDAQVGSGSISWRLGYPPQANLAFLDPAAAPAVGQSVGAYEDADRLFGGTIDEVTQELWSSYTGNKILYRVRAVGWEQRLQKRLMKPAASIAAPGTTYLAWAGTCNTSGTAVTWVSGDRFDPNFVGSKLSINSMLYTVSAVGSPTAATLSATAGSQSGVAFAWPVTCGNIFRSVVTNFADGEGFTLETIDDGETLEKEVYDHSWTVAAVLDRLAKASNKIWYSDPEKGLYFTARTGTAAPVSITVSNTLRESWECRTTREEAQNAHYRRVSFQAFAQKEAVLVGDASARVFYLDHPAALVESGLLRTVDGVLEATFGSRDAAAGDVGYDFYWGLGEYGITQDAALSVNVSAASNDTPIEITTASAHGLKTGHRVTIAAVDGNSAANGTWRIDVTASDKFTLRGSEGNGAYTSGGTVAANTTLTADDSLVVFYRDAGGDIVSAVDAGDQTNRGTIEGSSGKYEIFEDDSQSVDAVGAQEFANNIVGARAPNIIQARFQTETTLGLRVGQLASVTNSRYGLSAAQMLIEEITARDVDGQYWRCSHSAIDAVYLDGWREWFAQRKTRTGAATSVSVTSSSAASTGGHEEGAVAGGVIQYA